jgi:hypothetical protein
MSTYRIGNVQRVKLNNREVKLFSVYRLVDNAYVYAGRYSAPAKIANKNLINFVD